MTVNPVKWGILGCANFARQQILPAMNETQTAEIAGVASRNLEKAKATAQAFGGQRTYGSYDELLADNDIEAVYIPLPNSLHAPWSIKALQARKHVLCEKPVALNASEAHAMEQEAKKAGCLLLEAFMYRFSPLVEKACEIVRSGQLGRITSVHSAFSFVMDEASENVRLEPALGGGSLYDVGCYAVNVQRVVLGREPKSVSAKIAWSQNRKVDMSSSGILDFGDDIIGTFFCGFNSAWGNSFAVCGTKGKLEAPRGFIGRDAANELILSEGSVSAQEMNLPHYIFDPPREERLKLEFKNPYVLMLDDFHNAIRNNVPARFGSEPLAANMKVIDACFESDKEGTAIAL